MIIVQAETAKSVVADVRSELSKIDLDKVFGQRVDITVLVRRANNK